MYHFDRTKKMVVIFYLLSAISFLLTIIGFAYGGGEMLRYGFINTPLAAILMVVSFGVFLISLLTGLGLSALTRDIAEELKLLENRNKS